MCLDAHSFSTCTVLLFSSSRMCHGFLGHRPSILLYTVQYNQNCPLKRTGRRRRSAKWGRHQRFKHAFTFAIMSPCRCLTLCVATNSECGLRAHSRSATAKMTGQGSSSGAPPTGMQLPQQAASPPMTWARVRGDEVWCGRMRARNRKCACPGGRGGGGGGGGTDKERG